MNYVFSIIICSIIIAAGLLLRKKQNAVLLTADGEDKKRIVKATSTKIIGTGVSIIGLANIIIIVAYLIANKAWEYNDSSMLNWAECFVTVGGAIILILTIKRKEKRI